MKTIRTIWSGVRALWSRRTLKREIDEELRFHLEQRTAENLAAGMSPEEAAREARKRFGNVQSIREECRETCGASFGETTLQDARFGLRMLRKNPGFTTIAVLSLALGIGANTAIFSLLNAVLLRSLPVRNPHELRVINWMGLKPVISYFTGNGRDLPGGARMSGSFPYPTYRDFRDRGIGFSSVFAFSELFDCTVVTPSGATTAEGLIVSGNFFSGYGAQPLIGRALSPEDDRPEAAPAAVITYRLWERQFGLDPKAVGQTITLNNAIFAVVGVLPRNYVGPTAGDAADFYVPMSAQPQLASGMPLGSYRHWWVQIMGRLAPGANEAQARAALGVLFQQTLNAPGQRTKMDRPGIVLEAGNRGPLMVREHFAEQIYVLLAAVGLVLLIACANLASLLLARGAARQHEFAVRAAIGAGRWRLIRQSLTESLVLSLAGGGLGLLFAGWSKAALLGMFGSSLGTFHLDARTDIRVLLFTFAASLVTALLFGLLPALRAGRVDPLAGLKSRAALDAPRLRLGKALVVAQVTLSLLLVIGAGLFVRTFANLSRVDPGFDPENLQLFQLNAGQAGYRGQQLTAYYESVIESVAAIPGVRAATSCNLALLGGSYADSAIEIPGRPARPGENLQVAQLTVGDSFFSTMRIPVLLGRELNSTDTGAGPKAVMVNETFVRTYFPDENPIGKSIRDGKTEYQIVGVCGDSKQQDLRNKTGPTVYYAFRQTNPRSMCFEVRSVLPPASLVPAVRKAVAALNPGIPLTEVRTQTEQISRLLTMERVFASLCGFVAVLALLLSCVGLYGLMAYNVARRTGEIGIRMALGATRTNVAWPILREALLLASSGVAIGVPVALAATRVIRSTLFGIEPNDPVTIAGAGILLVGVAVLSAWLPARRASTVDPMEALRCE